MSSDSAKSSYKKLEKIGEGTFGIVYKAVEKDTGALVALKKIRPRNEDEGIPATTIREIILLKNLNHPNIIKLHETIHKNDKIYLVFEYIETDLKKVIDKLIAKKEKLSYKRVISISKQLLEVIHYCHSKNIFHRDIKPQNILIDSSFNIKLADFGLARAANVPLRVYTQEIVTLWYRPPELLLGSQYYDSSVDIWSIGCIMYELYTQKVLFAGDSEADQMHKIFNVFGIPKNEEWENVENLPKYDLKHYIPRRNRAFNNIHNEEFKDLLMNMLKYNPIDRITAAEALQSPIFRILD
ncbi:hypothetical protein NUSPORA_00033 [Nucleospora cyclopteri]